MKQLEKALLMLQEVAEILENFETQNDDDETFYQEVSPMALLTIIDIQYEALNINTIIEDIDPHDMVMSQYIDMIGQDNEKEKK